MELPYEMARRSLNNQPTLTERLGLPVRIIVTTTWSCAPISRCSSIRGDLKHHAQTYGEAVDTITLMARDRGFRKGMATPSAPSKLT
ncbi:MAG: DUF2274 domain-containing protein [Rhodocyclaceae bacterium]|nr:DUF2274 domain-containing protein [Rhodocyclaceae bacterium]